MLDDRQFNRQTDRQIDIKIHRQRQIDKQTDKWMDGEKDVLVAESAVCPSLSLINYIDAALRPE